MVIFLSVRALSKTKYILLKTASEASQQLQLNKINLGFDCAQLDKLLFYYISNNLFFV